MCHFLSSSFQNGNDWKAGREYEYAGREQRVAVGEWSIHGWRKEEPSLDLYSTIRQLYKEESFLQQDYSTIYTDVQNSTYNYVNQLSI